LGSRPKPHVASGLDGMDGTWCESHILAPAACILNPLYCTQTAVLVEDYAGSTPISSAPPFVCTHAWTCPPSDYDFQAASEGASSLIKISGPIFQFSIILSQSSKSSWMFKTHQSNILQVKGIMNAYFSLWFWGDLKK
jgi:hypothetical protein